MKSYKIKIKDEALVDILNITDWYNERVPNLGLKFQKNTRLQINTLKHNAYSFAIRYKDVRCTLVKKFPFLIHYIIDEDNKVVNVYAIIHTSRNPKIWERKTKK
ncbi:ParE toxin of type II toxin-antitoxin system, parDE [Mucilaginibacter mallensis]|uniref:ParE toxin of type II toxin-antitoxin system, parDE n=1 Tax=Mucilaginibacter mallensis TaxID=652787 RepID=A0A1H2C0L3_MUCMA|nr:type II toxin-antitoxin system RelE/ParE family toxin [Mucilaginibacter mallensis]SDT63981.1 ParE toxin of type II toxin-antitoxin system, parDE [Mucilaginibacter mallensis]